MVIALITALIKVPCTSRITAYTCRVTKAVWETIPAIILKPAFGLSMNLTLAIFGTYAISS